jgi:hypothetical protein
MRQLRVALTIPLLMLLAIPVSLPATTIAVIYPVKAKGSDPFWRIQRKGLWGFMDRSGNVVIEPRFVSANDFIKGLAGVCVPGPNRDGQRCGYIDHSGAFVIEPRFKHALDFDDGVAIVEAKDGWTLIDTNGNVLTENRFKHISRFSEGMTIVEVAKGGDGLETSRGALFGYIDTTGRIVVEPIYEWSSPFEEGLAAVRDESGQWGFIDKLGRIAIGFKFAEVTQFSGGVATVREPAFDKYGVIDTKGNIVRPFNLTSADPFRDGFAGAADAAGAGLIGLDGHFRFQLPNAEHVESPNGSIAQFRGKGGNKGFVDTAGRVLVEPIYGNTESFFEGRAAVHDDKTNRWGYVDATGALVIPPRFETANEFVDGLALVQIDEIWCYIDRQGVVVARDVWSWGR